MSAPDLTTEVIGYRQWRITENLKLRAAGHRDRTPWTPGENAAVCRRSPSPNALRAAALRGDARPKVKPCTDTPGSNCQCGFYALHDPSDFWYGKPAQDAALGALKRTPPSDPLVSGVIVAWGKVEVHHQGFRAELARIAALALPGTKRDAAIVRAAAAEYGVACVPVADLPEIAAEFGSVIPSEMRPEREPKPDTARYQRLLMEEQKRLRDQRRLNEHHWPQSWHYGPPTSVLGHAALSDPLWTPKYYPPKRRKWWGL